MLPYQSTAIDLADQVVDRHCHPGRSAGPPDLGQRDAEGDYAGAGAAVVRLDVQPHEAELGERLQLLEVDRPRLRALHLGRHGRQLGLGKAPRGVLDQDLFFAQGKLHGSMGAWVKLAILPEPGSKHHRRERFQTNLTPLKCCDAKFQRGQVRLNAARRGWTGRGGMLGRW